MPLKAAYRPYTFTFGFDARTSRSAMKDKQSWFINIWDDSNPRIMGIGESGPLPGLSVEPMVTFEEKVVYAVECINKANLTMDMLDVSLHNLNKLFHSVLGADFLRRHPSIVFALETALLDLTNNGARIIFHTDFNKGRPLPINGLVWMGNLDFMLQQVSQKINEGFSCIKLKVGGLDFEQECDVLSYICKKYDRAAIALRLDANGAFTPDEAMAKLEALAKFTIHSIEQPIKAGSGEKMRLLCERSPIPIALDEELIGVSTRAEKIDLLETIKPQFIILKPTLHGGLYSCQEWIVLAEERNIGWWITSALESNIGLNAIAQFTANYNIALPQGLGTGGIYIDNIPSPLKVDKGYLISLEKGVWDVSFNNQRVRPIKQKNGWELGSERGRV